MKLMIIDTALQRCSVTLAVSGDDELRIMAHETELLEKGHAECLAPMAQRALADAGWRVSDLARIGVVTGPGGFTGIRVGVAFARGLALGHACDLVGITSLEALALSVANEWADQVSGDDDAARFIAPLIDARRGEVYAALYDWGDETLRTVTAPLALTPQAAADWLEQSVLAGARCWLPGSGRVLLQDCTVSQRLAQWRTQTQSVDQIDGPSLIKTLASLPVTGKKPAPFYLRPPDAKPSARSAFDALRKAQARS